MQLLRKVNAGIARFSVLVTNWTGSTFAFLLSVLLIFAWLITGPMFAYSDTWQLVANTFTTLVEFVMVFVLQRTQNADTVETHQKMDRILAELDELKSGKVESKSETHTEV